MSHQASRELAMLFEATVALYHRLTADAAAIHRFGAMSGPRRTVLVTLARSGPQTVAHMARARAQSRQRFQPLVNRLVADGLADIRPNPRHMRSPLIALTAKGEKAATQIVRREAALSGRVRLSRSPRSVAHAAAVLRDVRLALETQLPRLLRVRPRRSRKASTGSRQKSAALAARLRRA
jgi:DNA-binding MarR family transcriptional regulator